MELFNNANIIESGINSSADMERLAKILDKPLYTTNIFFFGQIVCYKHLIACYIKTNEYSKNSVYPVNDFSKIFVFGFPIRILQRISKECRSAKFEDDSITININDVFTAKKIIDSYDMPHCGYFSLGKFRSMALCIYYVFDKMSIEDRSIVTRDMGYYHGIFADHILDLIDLKDKKLKAKKTKFNKL